ncbi:hypothetical protein D3C81_1887530 [compost metagenome]
MCSRAGSSSFTALTTLPTMPATPAPICMKPVLPISATSVSCLRTFAAGALTWSTRRRMKSRRVEFEADIVPINR